MNYPIKLKKEHSQKIFEILCDEYESSIDCDFCSHGENNFEGKRSICDRCMNWEHFKRSKDSIARQKAVVKKIKEALR